MNNLLKINSALILLDVIIKNMDNGFVKCERCGEQEDTKNLDFADDIKSLKKILLEVKKNVR